MKKPLVVAITGPTATGKTEAAITVCQQMNGEVISMDSMQIYRDLSIGTAKPTTEDMKGIPHHLLSFVNADASYTVAEYQRDASAVMNDIIARGKLPVFAGGTGLYLQAVSHPLRFTQAGHASEVRKILEDDASLPGGPALLHKRLEKVDPDSAARIHINNVRRVIRALEVFYETGIPMSQQANEWDAEPEEDWLVFALNWPRDVLYARINQRVDYMIEGGLVAEVERLLQKGVPADAQAMQAIGYREIVAMLRGDATMPEAIEAIKMNSRRYAKRQLTWYRRDARINWLDLSDFSSQQAAHGYIIEEILKKQEERNAND